MLFDSRKGKAVVLFMPNVFHANDCEKYKSGETKYFHEASFDAYCVGYGKSTILLFACLYVHCAGIPSFFFSLVFLRMAHLVAMNGVRCVTAITV